MLLSPAAIEELEKLLLESTRLRMISDVPLGCFLSGGVDSSMVAALMARASDRPVRTFTISFDAENRDESRYAKVVAEGIGAEHTEHRVDMDVASILPKLMENYDEPFADSSMIPTYCVSKAARDCVTVALAGDGGGRTFRRLQLV